MISDLVKRAGRWAMIAALLAVAGCAAYPGEPAGVATAYSEYDGYPGYYGWPGYYYGGPTIGLGFYGRGGPFHHPWWHADRFHRFGAAGRGFVHHDFAGHGGFHPHGGFAHVGMGGHGGFHHG